MNQLHSNQDRMMHKKRQVNVPIIGGGGGPPGAGAANPTATRETVPVVPSSTAPVAAAPTTRAAPDPVTLPSSTPVVATRPPATTAVVPSSTVVVPVASSTIASTASLLTTSAPLTVTVPARSSSSFASAVTSTSLSLTVVSGGTQAFSSGTLSLASSSSTGLLPTATSTSSRSSSTGITTGGIIGIIAGALVGVVVLATFIGFCVRRAKKNKVDDDHVFNKDDFRRESMLLEDEQEGNQMTEYAPSSLSRGNTSLPGAGRPRPPSMILNHYQAQQMQPSFQPGQIFQHSPTFNGHSPYPQGNPGMDLYGGYPTSPTQQQSLDRGLFGVQNPSPPPMVAQQRYSPPHQNPFAAQSVNGSQLARNGSTVSGFSAPRPQPPSFYEADDRERREAEGLALPHVAEERDAGSRSGTPVNSNVQQSYFSHGHTSSDPDPDPNHANRPFGKQNSSFTRTSPVETGYGQARGLTSPVLTLPGERSPVGDAFDPNTSRAQRTLSVRNGDGNGRVAGKTDSVVSDGYGGYA